MDKCNCHLSLQRCCMISIVKPKGKTFGQTENKVCSSKFDLNLKFQNFCHRNYVCMNVEGFLTSFQITKTKITNSTCNVLLKMLKMNES
jgi:hypothetical protein